MTLAFGNNIKELRLKRGLSQEKLAEHLCVSPQSISKWERNEGYPDITYLLPLAEFFDISLDELMGRDRAKKELKINETLNLIEHYRHVGDHKKKNELIAQTYKEFPYDFRIVSWYIVAIMDVEDIAANKSEVESLCNYILSECTQESLRYDAITSLVELYSRTKEYEKATSFAEKLPHMNNSMQFAKCGIYLDGDERGFHAMADYINRGLENILWFMCQIAVKRVGLGNSERISILEQVRKIGDTVYSSFDHCVCHSVMADTNLLLFRLYTEEGENKTALEALKNAFKHEKALDDCSNSVVTQTSTALRGNSFDMRNVWDGSKCNGVWWVLERLQESAFNFECYANDVAYQSILAEYRPYAVKDKTTA